jgi:hypothetical protein
VKIRLAPVSVLLMAFSSMAWARSHLQIKIFTSSPYGYSVNSTLVAHRLAATILGGENNLTTVYITHPYTDHYLGWR